MIAPMIGLALSVLARRSLDKLLPAWIHKSMKLNNIFIRPGLLRLYVEQEILAWGARGSEFESRHADHKNQSHQVQSWWLFSLVGQQDQAVAEKKKAPPACAGGADCKGGFDA